ncbi:hypothetical protein PRUPE_3G116200 [Prunus persica]|uniref:Uncharacterized protein n=1 Tax=Prunus persica TaxID=3760 RepID=A0A251PYN5_PRUPE|nr:hypothetical protein PRUPE_3G116200 [Prunus persica]
MTTRSHPPKPPPPNEPRTSAGNHPDSLPLTTPPPISSPPASTLNSNPRLPTTAWRPLSPSFRACSRRRRRFPARSDGLHLSLSPLCSLPPSLSVFAKKIVGFLWVGAGVWSWPGGEEIGWRGRGSMVAGWGFRLVWVRVVFIGEWGKKKIARALVWEDFFFLFFCNFFFVKTNILINFKLKM